MVRPCKLDTVRLDRKLTHAERVILLTAGKGDLTKGFQLVMSIYGELHNKGFKPDDPIESVSFTDKGYAENA